MPQPTAIGPYVVLRPLGSGGMGTVYLCEHRALGRRDAVKVPHPQILGDADALRRFEREAQVAAGFHHPHIAVVYDAALDHDPPYLAMAYVEGQSLRELLEDVDVLTVEHAARLLGPIASALDHCHQSGQTHRDVKPGNILIGRRDGREWPVLTDFGLVRADGASPMTATGFVPGTARYLSPEQVKGESAGPWSDLYSLACVAFECVTGVPPFRRRSDLELALAHRDDPAPRPSALDPRVSAEVDAVFAAALAKDPRERRQAFLTVSAFVEALARADGPAAVHATRVIPVVEEEPSLPADPVAAGAPAPRGRRSWAGALVFALVAGPAAFLVGDALVDRPGAAADPDVVDPVAAVTAPGEVLTAAQRELVAKGPIAHVTNCVPQPTVEKPPTTAAVGCDATIPGVMSLLLRQSAPGDALTAHMDSPKRPPGKCREQVGVDSTWDHGPLSCYDNTSGLATVWWGYADSGVNVLALRNDSENEPLIRWFLETSWSSPAGPPG